MGTENACCSILCCPDVNKLIARVLLSSCVLYHVNVLKAHRFQTPIVVKQLVSGQLKQILLLQDTFYQSLHCTWEDEYCATLKKTQFEI